MTVQIKRSQTIAGVSLVNIREFFSNVRKYHREDFSAAELTEEMALDADASKTLLQELKHHGFIERISEKHKAEWTITVKGISLSRASAAGKVRRSTADKALSDVLARINEINSRPDVLDDIAAVVVFGSFLTDSETIGDLDLAVKLRDRYPRDGQWSNRVLAYAANSGRSFSNLTEKLAWHQSEIYQLIKARKRTISVQPWDVFRGMPKDANFDYRVVFGDPDEVRLDLAKQ